MSTIDWMKELKTKSMDQFLLSIQAAEAWFPCWAQAIEIFADYGQHAQQDRIMRLLVRAYQSSDLRAGPAIIALLWRRIIARCCGDSERSHTLVVALLEVCARIDDVDRQELPMILIQAAGDRIKARGPHIKTTAISDLIPCAENEEESMADRPQRELLTPREAAGRLGVHVDTLLRMNASGKIDCIRLPSGHRRYSAEDVEAIRTAGAK